MGKITGFLEFEFVYRDYSAVEERTKHRREFVVPLGDEGVLDLQKWPNLSAWIARCEAALRLTGKDSAQ